MLLNNEHIETCVVCVVRLSIVVSIYIATKSLSMWQDSATLWSRKRVEIVSVRGVMREERKHLSDMREPTRVE